MKRLVLLEILRQINSSSALKRKVKTLALIGMIGIVVLGALAIWAGVSTIRYISNTATQVAESPTAQAQVAKIKSELGSMEFNPMNCWTKAQALLAPGPWLEKPALENFRNLKTACLQPAAEAAAGAETKIVTSSPW